MVLAEHPIIFNGPMVSAILDGTKVQTRRPLSKQPKFPFGVRRIVPVPDPWHVDALSGTPAYGLGNTGPRLLKWFCEDFSGNLVAEWDLGCPYGLPGDLMWVRETWADVNCGDGPAICYRADRGLRTWHDFSDTFGPDYGAGPSMDYDAYPGEYCMWWEDLLNGEPDHHWRPSIHMPRWASRILLKIVDIRAEPLQEITPADCLDEGVVLPPPRRGCAAPNPPDGWDTWGSDRQDAWIDDIARAVYFARCADAQDHIDAFRDLWNGIYGDKAGRSWCSNPWVWRIEFKRVFKE